MASLAAKIVATIAIYYSMLGLGNSATFIPPALFQYTTYLDSDLSTVSFVFTTNFVAILVSALICGQLFNYVSRHALITVMCAVQGIAIAILPMYNNLTYFFVVNFIQACCYGGIITGSFAWIPEIWKEKAAPIIQAQHFFFAFGTLFPPLIFKPFLEEPEIVLHDGNVTSSNVVYSQDDIISHIKAKIGLPTAIVGAIISFGAVLYTLSCCCGNATVDEDIEKTDQVNSTDVEVQVNGVPADDSKEVSATTAGALEPIQEESLKHPSACAKFVLVTIACIFFGCCSSMEMAVMTYTPAFVHLSDPSLSEAYGAQILSKFTMGYTLARLAGIFISFKVKSQHMLVGNLILITCANLILLFRGDSTTLLQVGIALAGMGASTAYPSFFEYFKSNILEVTNSISSVFVVGGGLIATVYITGVGKLIEFNPMILIYMNLVAVSVCVVVLIVVVFCKSALVRL